MAEMKLKLAEGRKVPMEDGRDWPEKGIVVELTPYIRRRLKAGDLVEVVSSKKPVEASPKGDK